MSTLPRQSGWVSRESLSAQQSESQRTRAAGPSNLAVASEPLLEANECGFQASRAGFLLLTDSLTPVYFNVEAVAIFAYPVRPEEVKSVQSFVAEKVRSIFDRSQTSGGNWLVQEFVSGRRRYVCRALPLEPLSTVPTLEASVAVVLERRQQCRFDSSRIAAQFNLSFREKQAVELLVHGFTSKEIAARMQISPNTVKAFLRFVMVKMSVGTRSGIMARLLADTF